MKKLLYLAVAAIAVSFYACSGSSSSDSTSDNVMDSLFTQADADTLMMTLGKIQGADVNLKIQQTVAMDTTIDIEQAKKKYMEGFQYVMSADTAEWYFIGMYQALQAYGNLKQMESEGITLNIPAFIESYRRAVMDPNMTSDQMPMLQEEFTVQSMKLQKAAAKADSINAERSEESVKNIEAGNKKTAELEKEGYASANGIMYKIANPGEGATVKDGDNVVYRYRARTIEGTPINGSDLGYAIPVEHIKPAGIGLAVKKLAKGGSGTFYIPGRLAFGVDGARVGAGPNEMIEVELEVVDINPAEVAPVIPAQGMPVF